MVKPRSLNRIFFWTGAVVFLVVVLPVALLLLPIHFGRQYWDRTRQQLEARGEKLFVRDFIKPEIPDQENYFAIPYYAEGRNGGGYGRLLSVVGRLEKKGDYLRSDPSRLYAPLEVSVFKKTAPGATDEERREQGLQLLRTEIAHSASIREEILRGSNRSFSNAKMQLQDGLDANIDFVDLSLALSRFLRLDAKLALFEHRTQDALTDFLTLTRNTEALLEEPSRTSFSTSMAQWGAAESIALEGLPFWAREELQRIGARLTEFPFSYSNLAFALRAERALTNETFRAQIEKGQFGYLPPSERWIYLLLRHYLHAPWANYNQAMQKLIDVAVIGKPAPPDIGRIEHTLRSYTGLEWFLHFFDGVSLLSETALFAAFARTSDENSLTRVAIALELWKRQNGSYPGTLSQLVPEYLEAIPAAHLPGQSIQYRRDAPLSYCIWTFGWNETDEGGTREKMGAHDGDWSLATDTPKP